MPGTFSQIYIHIVFVVKARKSLINKTWEDRLYKYITGTVQNKGQKMIAINGVSDHIHLLIGMKPSCCLSDLIREVKKTSNEFIKAEKFTPFKFDWQEGYGAFSHSHSNFKVVAQYVMNQKEHHRKKSFREEYIELLKEFEIEFKEEYLFEWIED